MCSYDKKKLNPISRLETQMSACKREESLWKSTMSVPIIVFVKEKNDREFLASYIKENSVSSNPRVGSLVIMTSSSGVLSGGNLFNLSGRSLGASMDPADYSTLNFNNVNL